MRLALLLEYEADLAHHVACLVLGHGIPLDGNDQSRRVFPVDAAQILDSEGTDYGELDLVILKDEHHFRPQGSLIPRDRKLIAARERSKLRTQCRDEPVGERVNWRRCRGRHVACDETVIEGGDDSIVE